MTCDRSGNESKSCGKRKFGTFDEDSLTSNLTSNLTSTSWTAKRLRKAMDAQLESEFRVLKSLIPGIAGKPGVSEVEIIDACVTYIESLQEKLREHDPNLLEEIECDQFPENDENNSPEIVDDENDGLIMGLPCKFVSFVRRNSLRRNQRRRR